MLQWTFARRKYGGGGILRDRARRPRSTLFHMARYVWTVHSKEALTAVAESGTPRIGIVLTLTGVRGAPFRHRLGSPVFSSI